jgi:hypothetical protein
MHITISSCCVGYPEGVGATSLPSSLARMADKDKVERGSVSPPLVVRARSRFAIRPRLRPRR